MTAQCPKLEIHLLYTPEQLNPGVVEVETLTLRAIPRCDPETLPREAAWQVSKAVREMIERAK